MFKAIFLDFYGTVVHEDDELINIITDRIQKSSEIITTPNEIGSFWWKKISNDFTTSFGSNFKLQRKLEISSLRETIEYFKSSENPKILSDILFDYWVKPPIFQDAIKFLKQVNIPVYIVSNIDRADILSAINYHELAFVNVFTSEDARSYKPRKEIFELALNEAKLEPYEVLHVGDSFSSDVVGAKDVGISVAWLNRKKKLINSSYFPDYIIEELTDLFRIINES